MARNKKVVAGNRKRAYRSTKNLPNNIQRCHEMVYDICLELGVCPSCQARPLFVNPTSGRVYARCLPCNIYIKERAMALRQPKQPKRRRAAA